MPTLFEQDYLQKKVLVVTNEEESGIIPATIDRVVMTCQNNDVPVIIFKDEAGKEFNCGGIVLPDTPETRAILDRAKEMYPNMKQRFWFLGELLNYSRNLDHAMQAAYRPSKATPLATQQPIAINIPAVLTSPRAYVVCITIAAACFFSVQLIHLSPWLFVPAGIFLALGGVIGPRGWTRTTHKKHA